MLEYLKGLYQVSSDSSLLQWHDCEACQSLFIGKCLKLGIVALHIQQQGLFRMINLNLLHLVIFIS